MEKDSGKFKGEVEFVLPPGISNNDEIEFSLNEEVVVILLQQ